MKKLKILGFVLFAVLALSAVVASAAFAEGEWLVEGKALAAPVKAETEGEIILKNYSEPGLKEILNEILCSGIFDGTIGAVGKDEVTEVLNLAMEKIGEDKGGTLSGTPLLCNVIKDAGALTDCKEGENVAEVYVANLPWKSELELMPGPDVLDVFTGTGGEPGYEVECLALIGIKGENLCESPAGLTTTLLENSATETPAAVLGFFNAMEDPELANCTLTGEHTGEVISETGTSGNTWAIGAALEHLATSIND